MVYSSSGSFLRHSRRYQKTSAGLPLLIVGLEGGYVRFAPATGSSRGPETAASAVAYSPKRSRSPYAWIAQTRPDGIIIAPMRTKLASGPLVLL